MSTRGDGRLLYQNFLVIAPAPAGDVHSDEQVAALAQYLNQSGYAYVARSGEKEMADDPSGVRYLPLGENLPCFGLMTAVVVINDAAWAERAMATYPDADVILLHPPMNRVSSRSDGCAAMIAPETTRALQCLVRGREDSLPVLPSISSLTDALPSVA